MLKGLIPVILVFLLPHFPVTFIFELQNFRQLLDENSDLVLKLRDLIIDWVQEGFQNFFWALDDHFVLLSGKSNSASQNLNIPGSIAGDKVRAGLVLVLAQLSLFIEQIAIPRITEASNQIQTIFFFIFSSLSLHAYWHNHISFLGSEVLN